MNLRRRILRTVGALVLLAVAVYLGDYAVLRFRSHPSDQLTVYHYLAIQEKNNRQEFVFQGSEQQTCVHSMLPHMGHAPCWYAVKHTEKRETI